MSTPCSTAPTRSRECSKRCSSGSACRTRSSAGSVLRAQRVRRPCLPAGDRQLRRHGQHPRILNTPGGASVTAEPASTRCHETGCRSVRRFARVKRPRHLVPLGEFDQRVRRHEMSREMAATQPEGAGSGCRDPAAQRAGESLDPQTPAGLKTCKNCVSGSRVHRARARRDTGGRSRARRRRAPDADADRIPRAGLARGRHRPDPDQRPDLHRRAW